MPNPLSQSSVRFEPGSGSLAQVPFAQGKTGRSRDHTARTPMRVMIVSVAVNVALDPLLIFGLGPFPRLEIEGAAIATITARAVATGLGLYVLFYTDAGPDIQPGDLVPDLGHVSQAGCLAWVVVHDRTSVVDDRGLPGMCPTNMTMR